MVRVSKPLCVLAVAAFATTGCATDNNGQAVVTNQAVGAAIGGIAGGLAGSQIGGGRGRTAAIIAGSLVGAGLGAAIAEQLSPQGQLAAEQTTQQTLSQAPTGSSARWQDPQTGIYGTVTPTSDPYVYGGGGYQQPQPGGTYYQPPSGQGTYAPYDSRYAQPGYSQPQSYATTSSLECRDYETSVVSGGQLEKAVGTMCRNSPNEPWRLQN